VQEFVCAAVFFPSVRRQYHIYREDVRNYFDVSKIHTAEKSIYVTKKKKKKKKKSTGKRVFAYLVKTEVDVTVTKQSFE
jgi:hypothetical protein